jgi:hypothetical protein
MIARTPITAPTATPALLTDELESDDEVEVALLPPFVPLWAVLVESKKLKQNQCYTQKLPAIQTDRYR